MAFKQSNNKNGDECWLTIFDIASRETDLYSQWKTQGGNAPLITYCFIIEFSVYCEQYAISS